MITLSNKHASIDFRRTAWDERIFNFNCAEITHFEANDVGSGLDVMNQFEEWAHKEDIKFAYGRFEPTPIIKQIVHHAGFYFAESSYQIRHHKLQSSNDFDRLIRPGPSLEPAKEADHEELRLILANNFKYGRIHEDPWIDMISAAARYRNWFSDLLAQKHQIFTYRLKNEIIGIHVQRPSQNGVDLVLTGVKDSHALLGVSLWADVMKHNRLNGVREIETLISAANLPIVNLYRRFEFHFDTLLLGFHKRWKNN